MPTTTKVRATRGTGLDRCVFSACCPECGNDNRVESISVNGRPALQGISALCDHLVNADEWGSGKQWGVEMEFGHPEPGRAWRGGWV